MLSTYLAIILGLFIIYKLSNKNALKESLSPPATAGAFNKISSSPHQKGGVPAKIGTPQHSVSVPSTMKPLLTRKGNALLLGGTQLYIFNTPEGAECQGRTQKERRHYYEDYEDIYKKKVTRFPGEDIRFDLLSPIPYSDAFVAPMGYPYPNIHPKQTLSKITYPHTTYPYDS